MVKIRAKQSLASNEYGKLKAGEYGFCKPSTAKYLEEKGMADIVEENVEAPVKEVKPFLTMKGYEPKQESKPVLYQPEVEEKSKTKDEPEKAAGKKEYDEEERAEQKKKQYK